MKEEELSKNEILALKLGRFKACFESAVTGCRPDEYQVRMNNLLLTLADYINEVETEPQTEKKEESKNGDD